MQGAVRLHEFIIKVAHPLEEHASQVYFHLHVVCVFFIHLVLLPSSYVVQFPEDISHEHIRHIHDSTTDQGAVTRAGPEALTSYPCRSKGAQRVRGGSRCESPCLFLLTCEFVPAYANLDCGVDVDVACHSSCIASLPLMV